MTCKDTIKYLIFKVTPHLIFDEIQFLIAKTNEILHSMIKGQKNIYVFLACDYANMGDYAITMAQEQILRETFPDRQVLVFPMKQTYMALKTILKAGQKEDIITIIGGGNMSELYYGYERKRNFIVQKMQGYHIIAFPQSIAYSDNAFGRMVQRRSAATYIGNKNFTLLARDERTLNMMKQMFPKNHVMLAPDVVLTLDLWKNKKRHGIVTSIRHDRESALGSGMIDSIMKQLSIYDVKKHDTCKMTENGTLDDAFCSLIDDYSSAEIVVTDRLHGMFLAYVTGTPAIVLPNNNGKIVLGNKWVADCPYIRIINFGDMKHLSVIIEEMKTQKADRETFKRKNKDFKDLFVEVLHNLA